MKKLDILTKMCYNFAYLKYKGHKMLELIKLMLEEEEAGINPITYFCELNGGKK